MGVRVACVCGQSLRTCRCPMTHEVRIVDPCVHIEPGSKTLAVSKEVLNERINNARVPKRSTKSDHIESLLEIAREAAKASGQTTRQGLGNAMIVAIVNNINAS